ncbi:MULTISPECIES: flagellar protein FlaG [unclassified Caulobacter]|jgi:flagellar protein FlaG|uniref:flagellar protein FlaG n=1 Tax=unclassified Caulobacter TaxID=2648921 RepID=UPI0007832E37|nr:MULTISPECIES: flagellar protein FlaG [unclassified Caulobacter]
MEPKAALSAIKDYVAPVSPPNAPEASEGAKAVVGQVFQAVEAEAARTTEAAQKAEPAKPVDDGPQPGDLRLVIEHDEASGEFVYKTVDRRTGETLQQFPREEVLRMRDGADYESGDVFDGQA